MLTLPKFKPRTVICVCSVESCSKEFQSRSRNGIHGRCPECQKKHQLEYQRRYYRAHKDKAGEYQRRYRLTHNKKKPKDLAPREPVKSTFNASDLMHAPMGKTDKMIDKIIKGERLFTM